MAALAAALLARGGCGGGGASFLLGSPVLRHGNHPTKKVLALWKHPVPPFLLTGQRQLHTAPIRSVLRLRPIHFLVATGGGYAGYRQYKKHQEKRLQNLGTEVPPRIASDWEPSPS